MLQSVDDPLRKLFLGVVSGCIEHKTMLDVVINKFYEQNRKWLFKRDHSQFVSKWNFQLLNSWILFYITAKWTLTCSWNFAAPQSFVTSSHLLLMNLDFRSLAALLNVLALKKCTTWVSEHFCEKKQRSTFFTLCNNVFYLVSSWIFSSQTSPHGYKRSGAASMMLIL